MSHCLQSKSVKDAPSTAKWAPFRPVQYLGSKLRVLDDIEEAASAITSPGVNAVDLFTGTTVVAQKLASMGSRVTAVDTQRYSQVFGIALLGVGKAEDESLNPSVLIESASWQKVSSFWREASDREDEALILRDAQKLRQLYKELPLIWRHGKIQQSPSISTVYAGTYFGVRQALEIDLLHSAIQEMTERGALSSWQRAVALTGLMHAASVVVHSAGKHFAQPLRGRSENQKFLDGRLLSDRSVSIFEYFARGCGAASSNPFRAKDGHASIQLSAERFVANQEQKQYQLYYIDPPYTAQQYSRFYHILETLAVDGKPNVSAAAPPTAGLYPVGRYKSAFSSKRLAHQAMEVVVRNVARQQAAAMISYSVSAAGSDGNARMIAFDDLLKICTRSFGSRGVECYHLSHKYRQFNNVDNANRRRDDMEVLILCKPG